MQVTITFRHMEASDALKEFVDHKISHFERFLMKPKEIHVIMSVEKHRHRAEVVLTEQNFVANADETTDDMYKSLESALTKIEKQVKRHKEKLTEHHKHHRSTADVALEAEHEYERANDVE